MVHISSDFLQSYPVYKNNVARGIGVLYKFKKYFTSSTLLTLNYSFIYPYLNDCNTICRNKFSTYLDLLV